MKIPKYVDTAEALKEHISAEKILHSFAKTVKNLSITKLIDIVKNMTDL